MSREEEIKEQLKSHPLQYGFVEATFPGTLRNLVVYNTENEEYAEATIPIGNTIVPLGRHRIQDRYNRCPNCEQWSPCDKRKELLAELATIKAEQLQAINEIAQLSQDLGMYE